METQIREQLNWSGVAIWNKEEMTVEMTLDQEKGGTGMSKDSRD